MYIHINDRSNLDEVVSFHPATKHRTTRREDLEKRDFHRTDVVLINGTRNNKEYCLFVTYNGFSGDIWILDILNEEQFEQVQEIARRMRWNAEDFEPARKLINTI